MSFGSVGDVIARHKPQLNNSTDCEAQRLLLPKASARPFHRFTVDRRASACRIETTTFRYTKTEASLFVFVLIVFGFRLTVGRGRGGLVVGQFVFVDLLREFVFGGIFGGQF